MRSLDENEVLTPLRWLRPPRPTGLQAVRAWVLASRNRRRHLDERHKPEIFASAESDWSTDEASIRSLNAIVAFSVVASGGGVGAALGEGDG